MSLTGCNTALQLAEQAPPPGGPQPPSTVCGRSGCATWAPSFADALLGLESLQRRQARGLRHAGLQPSYDKDRRGHCPMDGFRMRHQGLIPGSHHQGVQKVLEFSVLRQAGLPPTHLSASTQVPPSALNTPRSVITQPETRLSFLLVLCKHRKPNSKARESILRENRKHGFCRPDAARTPCLWDKVVH